MNNTITIRASVRGAENPETVLAALRLLGDVQVDYCGQVDYASAEGLSRHVWVYVCANDDKPLRQVASHGVRDGIELTGYGLQDLRAKGVCTMLYSEIPRLGHYGAPALASSAEAAGLLVSNHLFAVADANFEVVVHDRRDDKVEEYWLQIAMPG